MTTNDITLGVTQRNALRIAIRNHPDYRPEMLPEGRPSVNALPKDDLIGLARRLGIDPLNPEPVLTFRPHATWPAPEPVGPDVHVPGIDDLDHEPTSPVLWPGAISPEQEAAAILALGPEEQVKRIAALIRQVRRAPGVTTRQLDLTIDRIADRVIQRLAQHLSR